MARKRAPGGGRKPKGEFSRLTSTLSIRMPADMRSRLEASAARHRNGDGWALTQEILHRLQQSFDHEWQTPAPTLALAYLVSRLADDCSVNTGNKKYLWHKDSFAFEALEQALAMLLKVLRPQMSEVQKDLAEGNISPIWKELLSSPDRLATTRFLGLVEQLNSIEPTPAVRAEQFTSSKGAAFTWSQHSYVIDNVKRDLNLSDI